MIGSWLPVFLWMGIIYYVSDIPSLRTNLGVWDYVLRKLAHMTEYALLMVLMTRAWLRTRPLWVPFQLFLISGILTISYAISDEIHQSFVPGRTGAISDVLIDGCGIMIAILVLRNRIKVIK